MSNSAIVAEGGPANTTMMSIVHSALRRDLNRCAAALTAPSPPADRQRTALAAHLHWLMDFLHHHHAGEDAGLWPLVRSLKPSATQLLDQMQAEHAEIAPAIAALQQATTAYSASAGTPAREAVIGALSALREVLDPHLSREEGEMMPIVAQTLTNAEWETFNNEQYVKPKSMVQLGREGHWLIDSLDSAGYQVVVSNVPPIQRLVLVHAFAPGYARACRTRWGPNVRIKPRLN